MALALQALLPKPETVGFGQRGLTRRAFGTMNLPPEMIPIVRNEGQRLVNTPLDMTMPQEGFDRGEVQGQRLVNPIVEALGQRLVTPIAEPMPTVERSEDIDTEGEIDDAYNVFEKQRPDTTIARPEFKGLKIAKVTELPDDIKTRNLSKGKRANAYTLGNIMVVRKDLSKEEFKDALKHELRHFRGWHPSFEEEYPEINNGT